MTPEIRVALRNRSASDATYSLSLTVEGKGKTRRPLAERKLIVPAHQQKLFSHRWRADKHVGENRVHFRIADAAGVVQSGEWKIEVVESKARALPLAQFAWLDPAAVQSAPYALYPQKRKVTGKDVRNAIDSLHAIGVEGLIISYPEMVYSGSGFYYPSQVFREHGSLVDFDIVGTILSQASKNGQHVFVGLGRGTDLNLTWDGFDDAGRRHRALEHSKKIATELWEKYSREESFYGWYLTHEANDIAQASRAYYNPMVEFLRTFEADKPVMISPSGTPIISNKILADCKADVFAYQDAVGAGYVPYEYTFDPEQRIKTLRAVFEKYAGIHRETGKHLWANLELWQMDGPNYGSSYPADFARVRRQIDIESRHVDVITVNEALGFLESPASTVELGGPKAVKLYDAYRDHYRKTVGAFDGSQ